jgi:hypothetical protein
MYLSRTLLVPRKGVNTELDPQRLAFFGPVRTCLKFGNLLATLVNKLSHCVRHNARISDVATHRHRCQSCVNRR